MFCISAQRGLFFRSVGPRRGVAALQRRGGGPRVRRRSVSFAEIRAIFSGGSVFTADFYAVDGVTGKVASIIDWLDPTHALVQATSANQVDVPTHDSALNGAKSFTFAGSQRYVSNRAASAWKYLHGDSNTPSTTVAVFVPTTDGSFAVSNTIWGTVRQQDGSSQNGAFCSYTTATGTNEVTYRVTRSTTTTTLSSSTVTTFPQGVGTSVRTRYAEGAGTPEWVVRKLGTQIASGDSLAAPATGNPQSSLTVGANAISFDRGLNARLAFLAFAPKMLSTDESAALLEFTFSTYGKAA